MNSSIEKNQGNNNSFGKEGKEGKSTPVGNGVCCGPQPPAYEVRKSAPRKTSIPQRFSQTTFLDNWAFVPPIGYSVRENAHPPNCCIMRKTYGGCVKLLPGGPPGLWICICGMQFTVGSDNLVDCQICRFRGPMCGFRNVCMSCAWNGKAHIDMSFGGPVLEFPPKIVERTPVPCNGWYQLEDTPNYVLGNPIAVRDALRAMDEGGPAPEFIGDFVPGTNMEMFTSWTDRKKRKDAEFTPHKQSEEGLDKEEETCSDDETKEVKSQSFFTSVRQFPERMEGVVCEARNTFSEVRDETKAALAEAKEIMTAVQCPMGAIRGVANTLQALWKQPHLRLIVLSVLVGVGINSLENLVRRHSDAVWAKLTAWVGRIKLLLPWAGNVDAATESIRNKFENSFSNKHNEEGKGVIEQSEDVVKRAVAYVAGVMSAIGAGIATGSFNGLASTVVRVTKMALTMAAGYKLLGSLCEALLAKMPDMIQEAILYLTGVSSLSPEVKTAYNQSRLLLTTIADVGQNVWLDDVFVRQFRALWAKIHDLQRVGIVVRTSFELKVLTQIASDMQKAKPQDLRSGRATSHTMVPIIMSGPPGLGKTVLANELGRLFSPSPVDALWTVNASATHDVGLAGQPIEYHDDFGAVDDTEKVKAQCQDFLSKTSLGTNISNQADLPKKGMENCADFWVASTNHSFQSLAKLFNHPEAFERRIFSKTGVAISFRPHESLVDHGAFKPGLVTQLFSPKQLEDWEHVVVHLWRYNELGEIECRRLASRKDLVAEIMQSYFRCREMDASFMSSDPWPEETIQFKAYREYKELHSDSDWDGKSLVPVSERENWCKALTAVMIKEGEIKGDGLPSLEDIWAGKEPTSAWYDRWSEKAKGFVNTKLFTPFTNLPTKISDMFKEVTDLDLNLMSGTIMVASTLFGYILADAPKTVKAMLQKAKVTCIDYSEGADEEDTVALLVARQDLGSFVPETAMESIHRRKLPGRNRSEATGPARPVAALVNSTQESAIEMLNAQDRAIAQKISRNLVKLEVVEGDMGLKAHMLFVNANTGLTTLHQFIRSTMNADGPPNPDLRELAYKTPSKRPAVSFPDRTCFLTRWENKEHKVIRANLESKNLHTFPYSSRFVDHGFVDACLAVFPPGTSFAPFGQLKSHFIRNPLWSSLEGVPAFLIGYAGSIMPVGSLHVLEEKNWHGAAFDDRGRLIKRAYYTGASALLVYKGIDGVWPHGEGFCGFPLAVKFNNRFQIVGIHEGRYGNTHFGQAIPIDASMLETTVRPVRLETGATFVPGTTMNISYDYKLLYEHEEPVLSKDFGDVATYLGPCKGGSGGKSTLYLSPLASTEALGSFIATSKTIPTNMQYPKDKRYKDVNFSRPAAKVDYRHLIPGLIETLERMGVKRGLRSDDVSIAACAAGFRHPTLAGAHIAPLDLTTGAGVKQSVPGLKGKEHCFNRHPDGYIEPNEETTAYIQEILDLAREGYVPCDPYLAFYKDEGVKEEKIDRPRVVRCPPVATTCALRKEFHGILDPMYAKNPDSEAFVGYNPESRDWDLLVRRLRSVGGADSYADIDLVGMDDTHTFAMLEIIIQVINTFYDDPENDQLRFNLFMAQFLRIDVVDGDLVFLFGKLPSGTPMTTFLNVLNMLGGVKGAYLSNAEKSRELVSMEACRRVVAAADLGDDMILNICRALTTLDPAKIAQYLSYDTAGNPWWNVTSGSKDRAVGWTDQEEVTFLSRGIAEGTVPLPGMHYAPRFSWKRLAKSLKWLRVSKELGEEAMLKQKLDGLLLLMVGHGRPVFEVLRRRFAEALVECGYAISLRSYHDCLAIWERPDIAAEFVEGTVMEMEIESNPSNNAGPGVTQQDPEPPVPSTVPSVDSESRLIAAPELKQGWDFQHMVQRDQIVYQGVFNTGQRNGQVLFAMEVAHDCIVGTHRRAFSSFTGMTSGTCVLTIQMQGAMTVAGTVVVNVVPSVGANAAVEILHSKVNQTFLQHAFLKISDGNTVSVRVPFVYQRDAFIIGASEPYATVVATVFNEFNTLAGDITEVDYTVWARWEGCEFVYINPTPAATEEYLTARRAKFEARHPSRLAPRVRVYRAKEAENASFVASFFKGDWIPSKQEMDVVSRVAGTAANVADIVADSVDAVAKTLGGRPADAPNIGANPGRACLTLPYLANGASTVSEGQMLAMSAKPTRVPSPANFGIADPGGRIETLCRPTFYQTVKLRKADGPGVILASGWLNPAPILSTARLGQNIQPTACGYVTSRFKFWRATVEIKVDVIAPKAALARIVFIALPMRTEIPASIEDIASNYLATVDVRDGAMSHTFLVDYAGDTPRKQVPNGPATLDNSFGRWAIMVYNQLSGPSFIPSEVDVNIFFGLRNVRVDTWGMNNLSLRAYVGEIPYTSTIQVDQEKEKDDFVLYTKQEMMAVRQTNSLDTSSEIAVLPHGSDSYEALDGDIQFVEETLRRFVPVLSERNADALSGCNAINLVDLFQVTKVDTIETISAFAWWGSMFGGFSGNLKFMVTSFARAVYVGFLPSARITRADALDLVGSAEFASDPRRTLMSGFIPFGLLNEYTNGSIFLSNWIAQQRYARLRHDDEGTTDDNTLGAIMALVPDGPNTSRLNIFAAFADGALFGLPINVPRVIVNSANVAGDNYPTPYGAFTIGEYITFNHDPAASLTATIPQATLEKAQSAKSDGSSNPPVAKQQCTSLRLRTDLFSVADLRAFGFTIPTGSDINYDPDMDTTVDIKLTNIFAIPVVTVISFDSSAVPTLAPFTVQEVLLSGQDSAFDDTGITYNPGQQAVVISPWQDEFLTAVWGISVATEKAVPFPNTGVLTYNPTSTVVVGGTTYGNITAHTATPTEKDALYVA